MRSIAAFDSSTNYTLQEYTNDIVYYVGDVCSAEQVKHPDMKVLAKRALAVWPGGSIRYTWVPRERNKDADRLANEALDAAAKGREWVPRGTPSLAAPLSFAAPPLEAAELLFEEPELPQPENRLVARTLPNSTLSPSDMGVKA